MLLVASAMQADVDQLHKLLSEGELRPARKLSRRLSPMRLAKVLTEIPLPTLLQFLPLIGWKAAGDTLAYFPPAYAVIVMSAMEEDAAGSLLSELPADRAWPIVTRLPDELKARLMEQLDEDYRAQLEQLASYAEDTAGSVMSPNFLAVQTGTSVRDVIEDVRSASSEIERTAYVFVLDTQTRKLVGVVSLRELLVGDPNSSVDSLMTRDVFAIRVDEDAVEAARRIRSRRLKMFPVVDANEQLVGVIGIGQAIDMLSQDLADDFVAMHAASPDESFFTPPGEAVKKRLPWMAANIFLNLGAVLVISSFESTIVQVAILAAFLPMITDMGGNVGIQAMSVAIRSMALGEARLRDFWQAVRKELVIGLVNGLVLGTLFCVVAYVLEGNMVLGIVAGIALGCNVLLAGVVGGTMPFLIKRLGKDPAMMTGPILTTITDISGVTIYLGLCTVMLTSLL